MSRVDGHSDVSSMIVESARGRASLVFFFFTQRGGKEIFACLGGSERCIRGGLKEGGGGGLKTNLT